MNLLPSRLVHGGEKMVVQWFCRDGVVFGELQCSWWCASGCWSADEEVRWWPPTRWRDGDAVVAGEMKRCGGGCYGDGRRGEN